MEARKTDLAHGSATASAFSRVGLLVFALLIAYASLYPFSGWRDNGLSPWAYLTLPLPFI